MARDPDPPETNWVRLKSGARPPAPAPTPGPQAEPLVTPPPRPVGPPGAGRIGAFSVSQATSMVRRSDSNLARWVAVAFLFGLLVLATGALALLLVLV